MLTAKDKILAGFEEVCVVRGALARELAAESSANVVYLDDHREQLQLTAPADTEVEEMLSADQ